MIKNICDLKGDDMFLVVGGGCVIEGEDMGVGIGEGVVNIRDKLDIG